MNRKSLIQKNPYLKDSKKRRISLFRTVASSTAIEGVHGVLQEVGDDYSASIKPVMLREPAVSYGSRRRKFFTSDNHLLF